MISFIKAFNFKAATKKFKESENGSSTVEFVLVLPAFILFILGMFAISVLIATISDVQQLASDMTRQSLSYVYEAPDEEQLCANLQENVQPIVTQQLVFLSGKNISPASCVLAMDGRSVIVSITYDMKNMVFMDLLTGLGWPNTTVTRQAVMML